MASVDGCLFGLWRMPSKKEGRISYGPRQRMAVGANPLCNYGIRHGISCWQLHNTSCTLSGQQSDLRYTSDEAASSLLT